MKFSNYLWALLPASIVASTCVPRDNTTLPISDKCRCLPGDACWPSDKVWDEFNDKVDGRLIKTIPIGSPCHDPNYDEAACKALKESWLLPQTHIDSPSSIMQQFFANQSCDAMTSQDTPCSLGNYPAYAVKVSNSAQVAEAVKFANEHNIRLVIKNTGHDYFGRSTGAGALSIWTHHMKDSELVQWSDDIYDGPALKLGAGIQGFDAVKIADSYGLTAVSGECPTVGLAGFTLGGGHSPLSSSYGLGADNTLEFEVVTAAGKIVRASSSENSDLYWALSGGGAGNFGIVTSITTRAHKIEAIGGASLTMTVAGIEKATFDKAVTKFHELLPAMVDHGPTVVYILTAQLLMIKPVTLVNSTGEYIRDEVLKPFTDYLAKVGIKASTSYSTLSYLEHYDLYAGPLPNGHVGVSEYQYGGRLIPRSVLEDDNEAYNKALQEITSSGLVIAGSSGTYFKFDGVDNAVHPAWRKAITSMQIGTAWDSTKWEKMLADQKLITEKFVPLLEAVTPGSGTYMNEADFNQPNWEETFYSTNWDRLMQVKKKWDPKSLLYNHKGVNSDVWTVAKDGRMCRA